MTSDHFDIWIEAGFVVKVRHKATGQLTNTSLMNAIYWHEAEQADEPARPADDGADEPEAKPKTKVRKAVI